MRKLTKSLYIKEKTWIPNIFKSLNVLKIEKAELSYFYKKSEVTL